MIKRLAFTLATFFAKKGYYLDENLNVYSYGFELLISTVINAIGLIVVSLIMGIRVESVLFLLAFVPLRATAGGYHAQHHWSCFLTTVTVFTLFVGALNFMNDSFVLPYVVFSTLLSSIIIWSFSPIRTVNNPLHENQRSRFRERSIIIATANLALTFIFALTPNLPIMMLAYYQSGALAASISLAVAAITIKIKI